MNEKAVQKAAAEKYKEGIELHKKRGIETYILICQTGETCLVRQPTVAETARIMPVMNGMGYDKDGNQNEPDMLEAGTRLVKMIWVAGDDKIKKSEDLMAEVAMAAVTLIEVKIATVKKN